VITRGRRDQGSATVLALAAGLATVIVAAAVAAAGAAIVARHRAQAAADAAALAGSAQAIAGEQIACAAAATIAAANGAEMIDCRLEGWDVLVTVQVRPVGPAATAGVATGSARAGPV
jgi:secretion/DNA translocation related TadE-like protein